MKQQKLTGYTPNYPKKAVRGLALAAAALLALGSSAGCRARQINTDGASGQEKPTPGVEETYPPELEGYVAPADFPTEPPAIVGMEEYLPPEPEQEDVRTGGVAMPEDTPEPEEVMLSGDVQIIDEP